MAALLLNRGAFKIGLICNINRVLEGHQLRFYAKPLRRQAIRVLSVKEANDLAKRPRNSNTHNEIPKPDHTRPPLSILQKISPVSRASEQNGQKPNKIINESIRSNTPEKSVHTKEEDARTIDRPDKVEKRGKQSKNKGKDDWVTLADDVKYEKLETGDHRFGPAVMEAKLTKERDRKSTILLEGTRLVAEAVAASLEIKSIFFTDVALLVGLSLESLVATGTKLYKVSAKHMKVWSDTVAPAGLMAICTLPNVKISEESVHLPVTVICDRVMDAGSLGTLIRSAAAAGCSKLLVTRGSVDPWVPKVLRAGMGAHFHIPIITTSWEVIGNYLPSNCDLYLVTNKIPSPSNNNENLSKVPRFILQRTLVESNDENNVDESHMKRKDLKMFDRLRLPINSYESVDYASSKESSVALVVGSDDDGSSPEAKKFAYSRGGQLVFVPGANDLSQAITSSVVLFEIRRQMKQRNSADNSSNV